MAPDAEQLQVDGWAECCVERTDSPAHGKGQGGGHECPADRARDRRLLHPPADAWTTLHRLRDSPRQSDRGRHQGDLDDERQPEWPRRVLNEDAEEQRPGGEQDQRGDDHPPPAYLVGKPPHEHEHGHDDHPDRVRREDIRERRRREAEPLLAHDVQGKWRVTRQSGREYNERHDQDGREAECAATATQRPARCVSQRGGRTRRSIRTCSQCLNISSVSWVSVKPACLTLIVLTNAGGGCCSAPKAKQKSA